MYGGGNGDDKAKENNSHVQKRINNVKKRKSMEMKKRTYLKPEMANFRMESTGQLLAGSTDPAIFAKPTIPSAWDDAEEENNGEENSLSSGVTSKER
jgi:hypothetical protein